MESHKEFFSDVFIKNLSELCIDFCSSVWEAGREWDERIIYLKEKKNICVLKYL